MISIINEDTSKYLEDFVGKQFTERDFVALLLPLLQQNGIDRIEEGDLSEKLYVYYIQEDFRELFRNIALCKVLNTNKLDLHEGFYIEKFFSSNVQCDLLRSNILDLKYDKDIDLSCYERGLSEEGKVKIRQIAQELATRYKAERTSQTKLQIYNFDPNHGYSLVYGSRTHHLLDVELLTDGDIVSIQSSDIIGKDSIFYPNPLNSNQALHLDSGRMAYIGIQNATYTILRGGWDCKLDCCKVHTQILELEQLKAIVQLANQNYGTLESALTEQAPYVRKLVLK